MSSNKLFYGWWTVLGCFLIMAATTGIVMNSVPNAYGPIATQYGFQIGEVSTTTALVALAAMFSALLVGRLMKSMNIRILIYIFIVGLSAMALITIAGDIKWLAYVFAVVAGFAAAIMTIPAALWTAAIMGKKDFAIIYSVMNVFLTLGVALGPPISGYIFDAQSSYLPAIKLWMVVLAISMILALLSYQKRPIID